MWREFERLLALREKFAEAIRRELKNNVDSSSIHEMKRRVKAAEESMKIYIQRMVKRVRIGYIANSTPGKEERKAIRYGARNIVKKAVKVYECIRRRRENNSEATKFERNSQERKGEKG